MIGGFVAKGASDLGKWIEIARKLVERGKIDTAVIYTSLRCEESGSPSIRLVNLYSGFDPSDRVASRLTGTYPEFPRMQPDAYRSDERYIFGAVEEGQLVAEQLHVTRSMIADIAKVRPDIVFAAGAGTLIRTVALAVCRTMGIKALRVLGAHHMNVGRQGKRYFFCDNDLGALPAEPAYFRHDHELLTKHVSSFIEAVRARSYGLDIYARNVGRSYRVSASTTEMVWDALRFVRARAKSDRLSAAKLQHRVVYRWREMTQNSLFISEAEVKAPYLVFPLNVPGDAQLRLRAGHLSDVEGLVRAAAGNMPFGYDLLVKPHPGNPGMLDSGLIRRLRRDYPCIRFIDAKAHLGSLVERSSGVLVVNGSVALEAALAGKRCFHLGRSYLGELPNCVHLTSFEGFAARVLDGDLEISPRYQSDIFQLLHRFFGFTFPEFGKDSLREQPIEEVVSSGIGQMLENARI